MGNFGYPPSEGGVPGDPLSVVIFSTVMNTLLDTVSLRSDLGYHFSNSSRRVNILQYADDTCLVADSPASCLAGVVWDGSQSSQVPVSSSTELLWKVDRPSSQSRAGLLYCSPPALYSSWACRFSDDKGAVLTRLRGMLSAIDDTLLTRKQKLLLYSGGVCPRLTWPLLIHEFPITWME